MKGKTICALSDAAALPVLSFVPKFRDEFEYYVREGNSKVKGIAKCRNAPLMEKKLKSKRARRSFKPCMKMSNRIAHYCWHPGLVLQVLSSLYGGGRRKSSFANCL
jgi:hypothetical protein